MTTTAQPDTPDLETLQERREDIWRGIFAGHGDLADIAEYERLSAVIQDRLCARLDRYLDALRQPVSSVITIDHANADDWLESYSSRDYLPASEE
jgi:hypothetical protein